ncbi:MAG: ABC transporter permease [Thermoplasmata archaeon]
MRNYIIKRVVLAVVTLYVIMTISFFLYEAMPGDPTTRLRTNPQITEDQIAQMKKLYGYDKPLLLRYLIFIKRMFFFDFGLSIYYATPAMDVIWERLPRTVLLFGLSTILAYLIGYFVGAYLAWKRGGIADNVTVVSSMIFSNIPSFWLGLIILFIFAYKLSMFPLKGWYDETEIVPIWFKITFIAVLSALAIAGCAFVALGVKKKRGNHITVGATMLLLVSAILLLPSSLNRTYNIAWHLALPLFTLLLLEMAGTILFMRTAMIDVIGENYMTTAIAKGLKEWQVVYKHGTRNASLPLITSFILSLAFAVGGAVVLEQIFSFPGMGFLYVETITTQDIPLALAIVYISSLLVLIGNLIADILYGIADPRVRVE